VQRPRLARNLVLAIDLAHTVGDEPLNMAGRLSWSATCSHRAVMSATNAAASAALETPSYRPFEPRTYRSTGLTRTRAGDSAFLGERI